MIRLAALPDTPTADALAALSKVMTVAPTEQSQAIGALGDITTVESLKMLVPFLDNKATAESAGAGIVKIARKLIRHEQRRRHRRPQEGHRHRPKQPNQGPGRANPQVARPNNMTDRHKHPSGPGKQTTRAPRHSCEARTGRRRIPFKNPPRLPTMSRHECIEAGNRSQFVRMLKPAMGLSLACALATLLVAMFRWSLAGLTAQILLTCVGVFLGAAFLYIQLRTRSRTGPMLNMLVPIGAAAVAASQLSFLMLVWTGFVTQTFMWRLWWLTMVPSVAITHMVVLQAAGSRRGGPVEALTGVMTVWAGVMVMWLGLRSDPLANVSPVYLGVLAFPAICMAAGSLYILVRRVLGVSRPGTVSKGAALFGLIMSHMTAGVVAFYIGQACAENPPPRGRRAEPGRPRRPGQARTRPGSSTNTFTTFRRAWRRTWATRGSSTATRTSPPNRSWRSRTASGRATSSWSGRTGTCRTSACRTSGSTRPCTSVGWRTSSGWASPTTRRWCVT